ncbi:MAG: hypothetical protein LUB58_02580, partial [Oscillospiraceae bacterium]|nr:hypothetical protein [Oscillospiraceae bacterium]
MDDGVKIRRDRGKAAAAIRAAHIAGELGNLPCTPAAANSFQPRAKLGAQLFAVRVAAELRVVNIEVLPPFQNRAEALAA